MALNHSRRPTRPDAMVPLSPWTCPTMLTILAKN
ncbi:uncharacterized protein M6B38_122535 [Iris pallida]|uniref:Uncharacterized protein n=1 Tax=Iris pallida TaxID=29817 RepID=A0AAX6H2Q1_IRIPA|nr:uncharacterized protein M6B38_122535 [Iris pallida]